MTPTLALRHSLERAAEAARAAETTFRREAAARIAALEEDRAFAYRRLQLADMLDAALADIAAPDEADLAARAALCGRFGWSSANESQAPVIARFGELGAHLCAARDVDADDPARALAEFEDWYRRERGAPFWLLFEQPIVETPLVDF
jgi:hypothetical protein